MSKFEFKATSKEITKIKVVLLGDGAVGKTTLKLRYMEKGFRERYMPTLGADITIKTISVHDESLDFHIWDLAGQPKFNIVRHLYYRGSFGALLIYDITHQNSLTNLKNWAQELDKNNFIKEIPLLIIGNKIDLRETFDSSLTTEQGREFTENLKEQLGSERPIYFFESSAKTGQNVRTIFEKLGEEVLRFTKSR
ncbi:MAG: GTP-binding protein [Candidatus Hermodarchaeota archaeon]